MRLRRQDIYLYTSRLDDQLVMLHEETGDYISLNKVSTFIWDLLAIPRSIDEIIRSLLDTYTVDEETCRRQTSIFIREMMDHDLLVEIS